MSTFNHGGALVLRGRSAIGNLVFLPKEPRNPLEAYPSLLAHGRPYNDWLTEEILLMVIRRWGEQNRLERAARNAVREEFESASGSARLAFAQVLPAASVVGDPAVLAVLGVTANLQRTLATLAEFVSDDRPAAPDRIFRLSRHWCGLAEYPDNAPYFPSRIKPPSQSVRLRPYCRRAIRAIFAAPSGVRSGM